MPPYCASADVDSVLKHRAKCFGSSLNIKGLLLELHSADVLDDNELDSFLARKQEGCSNRELAEDAILLLRGKSKQQKVDFLLCVKEKQPHLVDDVTVEALLKPGVTVCALQEHKGDKYRGRDLQIGAGGWSPIEEVAESSLSPAQCQMPVTRRQALAIGKKAGSKWKKLARRLSLVGHSERMAFKEERITAIERAEEDGEDRLVVVIEEWRSMNARHTWGLLWDAFREADMLAIAEQVFPR